MGVIIVVHIVGMLFSHTCLPRSSPERYTIFACMLKLYLHATVCGCPTKTVSAQSGVYM